MSSRSASPVPPSGHRTSGPESSGGGSGTLSNDALYAPLSTYVDCSASTSISNDDDATTIPPPTKNKKKKRHSLSLQTSSSLRESSLITFLTSMSQNLKTSHPQEYQLYRGMGGSIARFGMGDTDRANGSMRSILEGKLMNRSLVLVGGGVHGHNNTTSTSSKSAGGEPSTKDNASLVGLGMISQSASSSSGKRDRKRVGGNGNFGSISNKKRKKLLLLQQAQKKQKQHQHHQSAENEQFELKVYDGDGELDGEKQKSNNLKGEKTTREELNKSKVSGDGDAASSTSENNHQQQVGSVIETLHQMWTSYMHQLLTPIKEANNAVTSNDANTITTDPPSLSLEERKEISYLLATSEHVGMPATIVECLSRRHLVSTRCIVLNETKETWKIAMLVMRKQKTCSGSKGNDVGGGKPKEDTKTDDSCEKKGHDGECKASALQSHLWKVVMVPRRGTALEVDLPWNDVSAPNDNLEKKSWQTAKNRLITVRLEA